MEEIKFNKCIYIQDVCLERLSSIENLQASLYMMEVVSCGNVTDKGLVALHRLKFVAYEAIFFKTLKSLAKMYLILFIKLLNKSSNTEAINYLLLPFRNLEYLFLSDLPGIKDRHATVERLQKALPRLDVALDLDWFQSSSGTPHPLFTSLFKVNQLILVKTFRTLSFVISYVEYFGILSMQTMENEN